jgi:cyanophycin synthetase
VEIRKVLALRGPNLWANFPVLEAWVDLQELKDSPSDSLPGFNDRVMAWLPTMIEHRCGLGYRGGFFERLRTGTYMGHILEHVTLELQSLAGSDVGYGKARETAEEGVYKVVIEYEEEAFGRAALDVGFRLLQAAIRDQPFDVANELERLRELLDQARPDADSAAVLLRAQARGIPAARRDGEILLGWGTLAHRIPVPATEGSAVVDRLFPAGETGRIPIVSVTGVNGKTTVTRLIAHVLRQAGRVVGMTCTDGIEVDGRRIEFGDCSGPISARTVLAHPDVEAAVLETARGGILREGLGFDRCDVAVVTNIGEGDHLGLSDIQSLEKLAQVKRCIVEVVSPDGYAVLNSADPLVAEMAAKCPGRAILFARTAENDVIAAHRTSGGRAVFVCQGEVILAEGDSEVPLLSLDRVPMTRGGRIGFQVENALAAVAAGWGLGLTREIMQAGLETFLADERQAPGRFNVLETTGPCIIIDYGHNPSALVALLEAIEAFPQRRRTISFTTGGDRRDEDLERMGALLGEGFDRVVLYEYRCRRGRPSGEMIRLFRQGLASGNRVREIREAWSDGEAIALALEGVGHDDLVVIQAEEDGDEALGHVRQVAGPWLSPAPTPRETRPETRA